MKSQPRYTPEQKRRIVADIRSLRHRRPGYTWIDIHCELTSKYARKPRMDFNEPLVVEKLPSINTLRNWLAKDERFGDVRDLRAERRPSYRVIRNELVLFIKSCHVHPGRLRTSRKIQGHLKKTFGISLSHSSIVDALYRELSPQETTLLEELWREDSIFPAVAESESLTYESRHWKRAKKDTKRPKVKKRIQIGHSLARALIHYFEAKPERLLKRSHNTPS